MQVQNRLEIIEGDVAGMAGPDKGLSCLATVTVIEPNDGADQLLNHDLYPHWNGIRKKFLLAFPNDKAMKLWEQYAEIRRQSFQTYRDIRMATVFYKKIARQWTPGRLLRGMQNSSKKLTKFRPSSTQWNGSSASLGSFRANCRTLPKKRPTDRSNG
ncbi:MAG: hypothetical protein IPL86_19135 [Flavobacteriales bacterium]|nr:hypothetical protein [Flavobacteriales bacterium]